MNRLRMKTIGPVENNVVKRSLFLASCRRVLTARHLLLQSMQPASSARVFCPTLDMSFCDQKTTRWSLCRPLLRLNAVGHTVTFSCSLSLLSSCFIFPIVLLLLQRLLFTSGHSTSHLLQLLHLVFLVLLFQLFILLLLLLLLVLLLCLFVLQLLDDSLFADCLQTGAADAPFIHQMASVVVIVPARYLIS